jgi:prepilin signal peptidase PulO-like enzyme (type II secretory pathway)
MIIGLYVFLGLCIGSFASAISYRIQNNLSWISKKDETTGRTQPVRSMCTACEHQLSFFDLIPLLSWLWNRGRCRYCSTRVSIRYPIIESSAAFVTLTYHFLGYAYPEIIILLILLPFSLSFILLILNRYNPPLYIYVSILLNITLFMYH